MPHAVMDPVSERPRASKMLRTGKPPRAAAAAAAPPKKKTPPFDLLPIELVAEIMVLSTIAQPDDNARFAFPATLLYVSHLWKEIAQKTPAVWTTVLVKDPLKLQHAPARLHRSGDLPLNIIIDEDRRIWGPPWWSTANEIMECLGPSSKRWQRLRLHVIELKPYLPFFPPTFPQLSYLDVDSQVLCDRWDPFFSTTPKLTHAHILGCSGFWSPPKTFNNLSVFTLGCGGVDGPINMGSFLNYLESCSGLQELEIRDLQFDSVGNQRFDSAMRRNIPAPELSKFTLEGVNVMEVCILLSAINSPKVSTLSVRPSYVYAVGAHPPAAYLWTKMTINFPALRRLKLTDWDMKFDDALHFLRQLPPLRHLWFNHILPSRKPQSDLMNQIFKNTFSDSNLHLLTSNLSGLYATGIDIDILHEAIAKLVNRVERLPHVIISTEDLKRTGFSTQKRQRYKQGVENISRLTSLEGRECAEIVW